MIDIFDNKILDLSKLVCHSGGAEGSDSYFEEISDEYGVKVKAYSYKTNYHLTKNKTEISDDDYNEGVKEILKANRTLGRYGINKYMNLLARNWAQVKYSDEIFAIGEIIKPGCRNSKGYYNKSKLDIVNGGTGYAVMMAINHNKNVYVFDQMKDNWFRWSYSTLSFIEINKALKIKFQNFAGIGTREIKQNGINAIRQLYESTFLDNENKEGAP